MAPVDPKVLQLMMQSINPAMYMKWAMSPLDPQWMRAGVNTVNPATYLGWMGAGLNPPLTGHVERLHDRSGTGHHSTAWRSALWTGTYTPFDPNALMQMFAVPGTARGSARGGSAAAV